MWALSIYFYIGLLSCQVLLIIFVVVVTLLYIYMCISYTHLGFTAVLVLIRSFNYSASSFNTPGSILETTIIVDQN